MGVKIVTAIMLILYFGSGSALPIADVRANFNFTLPLRIPAPTFLTNRSMEETFTDVARIMTVSKTPFRYGKRSAPPEVVKPADTKRSEEKMYSARGSPFLSELTPENWAPSGYHNYYHNRNGNERILKSVPGFSEESFGFLLDLFLERKLLQKANEQCKSPELSAQIKDLDKLLEIVEFMEDQRNSAPVKKIENSYKMLNLARARPGKRSAVLQEQQHTQTRINVPVVFSIPSGEKTGDASNWLEKITVAEKKTVAYGEDGFRRGNRPFSVGYN